MPINVTEELGVIASRIMDSAAGGSEIVLLFFNIKREYAGTEP